MGVETALLAGATAAGGTALPWLTTAGSLSSIASAGGLAGSIAGLSGVASAFSSGLSLLGGISSFSAGSEAQSVANSQKALALQTAELNAIERERVTAKEARVEKENSDRMIQLQKLAYMKSGVSLAGSPLLVMEETRRKGAENIDEILRAGRSSADSVRQEGRITAGQFEAQGRKAFNEGVSGLMSGVQGAFS
jgi:hypothetical protein